MLLPTSGSQETDSRKFDVNLLFILISRIITGLTPSNGSWEDAPKPTDTCIEDDVVRINMLRRTLYCKATSYFDDRTTREFWEALQEPCTRLLPLGIEEINQHRPKRSVLRYCWLFAVQLIYYFSGMVFVPFLFGYIVSKLYERKSKKFRERTNHTQMFYDRGITDNLLEETLNAKSESRLGIVLTGHAGVGKTELAKSVCNKLPDTYNVIWLEGEEEKIRGSFAESCKKLNVQVSSEDSLKVLAYKLYSRLSDFTVIVLDNVTNCKDVQALSYDHNLDNFVLLLITSQISESDWNREMFSVHRIGTFSETEAFAFVNTYYIKQNISNDQIDDLIETLEYFPLTLNIAVSYLNNHLDVNIETYLQMYKEHTKKYIGKSVTGYEHNMIKVWKIIKNKLNPASTEVLAIILSFLNGKKISKNIFQNISKVNALSTVNINDKLTELSIETILNDALDELRKSCILTVTYNDEETEQFIHMHSAVQAAIRVSIDDEQNAIEYAKIVIALLNVLIIDETRNCNDREKHHYNYGIKWVYHLAEVIQHCNTDTFKKALQDIIQMDIMHSLNMSLLSKGNYTTCNRVFTILRESLNIGATEDNQSNEKLMEVSYNIAYCLLKMGNFKSAKTEFEQLVPDTINDDRNLKAKLETTENDRLTNIRYFVGHCLMKNEQFKDAIKTLEDVSQVQQLKYSASSQQYLLSRHDIAYSKFKSARYLEARQEFEKVFSEQIKVLGPYHKNTLLTSHSLGHCLLELGKYEEAKASLESTLQHKTEALGELHHETLITYHTLGLVLMHLKHYDQAARILDKVYNTKVNAMGRNHPSTLVTRHRVGNCKMQTGDFKSALVIFQKVYESRCKVLGVHKERTLLTRCDIGACLMKMGDYEEAQKHLTETKDTYVRIFGEEKVYTFTTMLNLALCYKERASTMKNEKSKRNSYVEALKLFEQVLLLQAKHYGDNHQEVETTRQYLHECQQILNI